MIQEEAIILKHENFQGDYRILHMNAPKIGPLVTPGQFIHLKVPKLNDRILRRPFSVYKADNNTVTLLYKPVGRGTETMITLNKNDAVDIIGPLGNGYPEAQPNTLPVLVAGGYGLSLIHI